ncbi:CLUMA_CG009399, isoform A [Clunio marinus]|uniref:Sugar phosphate phosphatase n=1 Tax=Clunio marinus TaxID=568069 RepID=A0A1J1I8Q8_9DIPT|nr:CLUMA_CG009399, isoform A [Clunio marinus]
MSNSIDFSKYKLSDEKTPINEQLTAHYKRSYAFYTIATRVPIIITNIIDQLTRDKEKIIQRYGEHCRDELKQCIGEISKLKYELQTDKKMTEIPGDESDQYEWNRLLKEIEPNNSYFSSVWLYAECYVYRRLKSIFDETISFGNFDYFEVSKKLELSHSMANIARVLKSVNDFNNTNSGHEKLGNFFRKLLKVNLWGNRNDLSITLGQEIEVSDIDPLADIEEYNKELLVDQTIDIWNCIKIERNDEKIVSFINDNAGYELLCDLVLADFIIHHKLAKKIRFYVKSIPWFISDVLPTDFRYTLDELRKHDKEVLREAGSRWESYLREGIFELIEPAHMFFTSPFEYYKMEKIAPELYHNIAEAHLVIFKGDLNYRKLLADTNWDTTTEFRTSLSGFEPTNLCALRTIKADLISGLQPGVADRLWEEEGSKWMSTGKYGVIQFIHKRVFTQ